MSLIEQSSAHKRQAVFVHQTPLVVRVNLMSFVPTVAVKGHQEDHTFAITQFTHAHGGNVYKLVSHCYRQGAS